MRRLFAAVVLVAALGCHSADKLLGPVQDVNGEWRGTQNGYQMSLAMTQTDTVVTGTVLLAGVGGAFQGNITGTFKYPTLVLYLNFDGFEPLLYDGTMLTTSAQILGVLNGSGFQTLELDVRKR